MFFGKITLSPESDRLGMLNAEVQRKNSRGPGHGYLSSSINPRVALLSTYLPRGTLPYFTLPYLNSEKKMIDD